MHKVLARDSCVLVQIDGAIAEANLHIAAKMLHAMEHLQWQKSSFGRVTQLLKKQAQLPVLVVSYLLRSVFMVPGCKIVGCQYD